MKAKGKLQDFEDLHAAWKKLLEKIGSDGKDFPMFSSRQRKRKIKFFHAKVEGQFIIVDSAKEHNRETVKIDREIKIDFDQFRDVYEFYYEYADGIRPIRGKTSYIISLIHDNLVLPMLIVRAG